MRNPNSNEIFNKGTQSFGERLKLGFGTSEDKARQQEIEKSLGLKGVPDIGDLADIAGGSLPFIGSLIGAVGGTFAGGPVGSAAGAGVGAAAGESVKNTLGQLMGVRQGESPITEAFRPIVSGVTTAAGYKFGGAVGEKILVPVKNAVTKILPERLYAQIFKRSKDDFAQLMRTETWQDLQRTNPEMFNRFVDQGLLRTGASGKVEVNPTLAQEILDRGVWGSAESMTKYAFTKQLQLESGIRQLLTADPISLTLPKPKSAYMGLLKDISDQFSAQGRGFFSERVADARVLMTKLKNAPGNSLDGIDVLTMRRFFDSMRNTGSFRLNPNLAPKQEAFKIAADGLRRELATVPGISENMNEYRIWIEAIDDLVDHAVKTGNNKLLNLTDVILGGGGLSSGVPGSGFGLAALVRLFQTPSMLTGLGQVLNKAGNISSPKLLNQYVKYGTGKGVKNTIGGMLNE